MLRIRGMSQVCSEVKGRVKGRVGNVQYSLLNGLRDSELGKKEMAKMLGRRKLRSTRISYTGSLQFSLFVELLNANMNVTGKSQNESLS